MINFGEILRKPSLKKRKADNQAKLKQWQSDTKAAMSQPKGLLALLPFGTYKQLLAKVVQSRLKRRLRTKKNVDTNLRKGISKKIVTTGSLLVTKYILKSNKTKVIIAGATIGILVGGIAYYQYKKRKAKNHSVD